MHDLKRRFHDVIKRWKNWLPSVAIGFVSFVALLYRGPELWRSFQEVDLKAIPALFVFIFVGTLIFSFAWSYRIEIFVAVVGMVIGAVAGVFPYLVILIILLLLELSTEGQATNRELAQLFDNDLFSQLFYVAGAASGGPIAVYVYIEEKKKKEKMKKIAAEKDEDR